MGYANWSKFPVLSGRHFCGVFLRKNNNLSALGDQKIFAPEFMI